MTRTPEPHLSDSLTRLCTPPRRRSSAPVRVRYRDLPANRATTRQRTVTSPGSRSSSSNSSLPNHAHRCTDSPTSAIQPIQSP